MFVVMSEVGALNPVFGIGDRIRKARQNVGLDQKDIAEAAGVSRPLVSRWERDLAVPDLKQAVAIAELTGTSLVWIAGLDQPERLLTSNRNTGPDRGFTDRSPQPDTVAA